MRKSSIVLFYLSLQCTLSYANIPAPADHQKAVEVARQGKTKQALKILEKLYKEKGHYTGFDDDYIVVLIWAGKDQKAIHHYQNYIKKNEAPLYVLEAVGDAYYRQGKSEKAEQIYTFILKQFSNNLRAQLGLIRLLLDQQKTDEGMKRLLILFKKHPSDPELLSLKARAHELKSAFVDAIRCYDLILKQHPHNKDAIEKRILALSKSGAPMLANEKAAHYPEIFDEVKLRSIRADEVAITIRWAKIDSGSSDPIETRYRHADRAIALINQYFVQEETEKDRLYNLRLKYDLMVGYYYRDMTKECIDQFEELRKEFIKLEDFPEYVLEAVVFAYITERDIKPAKEIALHLYNKNKKNPTALKALYYGHLEYEENAKALDYGGIYKDTFSKWIDVGSRKKKTPNSKEIIEELVKEYSALEDLSQKNAAVAVLQTSLVGLDKINSENQELFMGELTNKLSLVFDGVPLEPNRNPLQLYKDRSLDVAAFSIPNDDRNMAEEIYSSAFTDAEILGQSEKYLLACIAKAPFNGGFRSSLAQLYFARSLPRATEKEAKIGLTIDPENSELKIALANSLIALNEFKAAEEIILYLQHNYPKNTHVTGLLKNWGAHNSMEFTLSAAYTRNRGASSFFGKKESYIESSLYSRPILYNYRSFVFTRYDHGRYSEGLFNQSFTRAGMDYRARYLEGIIAANYSRYGKHKVGFLLDGKLLPSDHWSVRGRVDVVTGETPAIALLDGVSSNLFEISGQYTQNESFSIGMLANTQHFTDHNVWKTIGGKISKRLFGNFDFKIDTELDVNSSNAKYSDVNYYSPKRSTVGAFQGLINHKIYRYYEFSFRQILTVSVGRHWEKNYQTKTVGAISYEHEIEDHYKYSLKYGIQYRKASYDGQYEKSTMVYLRFNIKI